MQYSISNIFIQKRYIYGIKQKKMIWVKNSYGLQQYVFHCKEKSLSKTNIWTKIYLQIHPLGKICIIYSIIGY